MINSLHLRNFKGIRQADIGLERLTVVVGPNASGKTSILEAIHNLSLLGAFDPVAIFQGRKDPLLLRRRNASGEEMELSCLVTTGGIRLRIAQLIESPNNLTDSPARDDQWAFHLASKGQDGTTGNWLDVTDDPQSSTRMLRPANFLRLDAARMANPSSIMRTRLTSYGRELTSADGRELTSADGRGLASALAFMALNQPDDFQQVQNRLKAVVPAVERVRFDRAFVIQPNLPGFIEQGFVNHENPNDLFDEGNQSRLNILFDFKGAYGIPAHLASEGTILVLGLLTALTSRKRSDLVLLDDLDHGLHPRAQREVVGLLRAILNQDPDLQIVATTHSPYLVDCLRPEEVRLTTLNDDGTVSIAGLVEHPDFDKWKDEMAPGEMWSLFGERWVGDLRKDPVEK